MTAVAGGPAGDRDGERADAAGELTRLRPARARALPWSLVGLAATGLATWLVADTGGHALAVALLVACLVTSATPVAHLVAPGAFAWVLDRDGLHVRRGHRRLLVGWSAIRLARVVDRGGDPALELHLRAPADAGDRTRGGAVVGGRPPTRGDEGRHTLRLPVGADVAALHRALETHLDALPEGTPAEDHPSDGPPS